MRNYIKFFIFSCLILFPFYVYSEPSETKTPKNNEILKFIEKFGPDIYTVNAYIKKENEPSKNFTKSDETKHWNKNVGTAFAFDNKGHFLTLGYLINKSSCVKLISNEGKQHIAKVIGYDKTKKLAVLEIDSETTDKQLQKIASCSDIKPGCEVFLLGIVKGKSLSLNSGVISDKKPSDGTFIVESSGNPSISGTIVIDKNENIIGIIAYQVDNTNSQFNKLSYIVFPMEYSLVIAHSIVNENESRYGWLGIASSMNYSDVSGKKGIVIQKIFQNSPAEKCGLKENDCLIEFNNIAILSPINLIQAISLTKSGDIVPIKYRRGEKTFSSSVTLSSFQKHE